MILACKEFGIICKKLRICIFLERVEMEMEIEGKFPTRCKRNVRDWSYWKLRAVRILGIQVSRILIRSKKRGAALYFLFHVSIKFVEKTDLSLGFWIFPWLCTSTFTALSGVRFETPAQRCNQEGAWEIAGNGLLGKFFNSLSLFPFQVAKMRLFCPFFSTS